jgi:hypothetical protein
LTFAETVAVDEKGRCHIVFCESGKD